MASEFDPIKAATEQLAGLLDVHKVLIARCRDAEMRYVEAEAEHNQLLKLEAFVRDLTQKARTQLEQLKMKEDQT